MLSRLVITFLPKLMEIKENPMDGGTRWATVPEVTKSRTRLTEPAHKILRREEQIAGLFMV